MPEKLELTVESWLKLVTWQIYKACVSDIAKDAFGTVIEVIFSSLSAGDEPKPLVFKPILKENENAKQP